MRQKLSLFTNRISKKSLPNILEVIILTHSLWSNFENTVCENPVIRQDKMNKNAVMIPQTLFAFSQTFPLAGPIMCSGENWQWRRTETLWNWIKKNNWSVKELQRQFDSSLYVVTSLSSFRSLRPWQQNNLYLLKPFWTMIES